MESQRIGTTISIHAPAKGATGLVIHDIYCIIISIHAPAKGATRDRYIETSYTDISIHAPAKGATRKYALEYPGKLISIHAPAKGATNLQLACKRCNSIFQSTLPQRERLVEIDDEEEINIFQSTLPQRERPIKINGTGAQFDFNPRSRKGSDGFVPLTVSTA